MKYLRNVTLKTWNDSEMLRVKHEMFQKRDVSKNEMFQKCHITDMTEDLCSTQLPTYGIIANFQRNQTRDSDDVFSRLTNDDNDTIDSG